MCSAPLTDIIFEESWQEAIERILKSNTTIIIGGIDCGKSTFARYLLKKLFDLRGDLILIDADIGQSSISLPGTIGLKKIATSYERDNFADEIFFVGYTTPSVSVGYFLEVFSAAVERAKSYNLPLIVDTDGFISDEGVNLKLRKIEILNPNLVIAFQKERELETIIRHINTETIILKPSSHVRVRDQNSRAEYRLKRFQFYFKNSESYMMPVKLIKDSEHLKNVVYNLDKFRGTLIGLMDEKQCIGLGLIEDIDSKTILIRTPISGIYRVKKILIGKIKLSELT